jgi:hypothetical protein
MYKFTKIQKKSNKDTLFFLEVFEYPKEYINYVDKNYKQTGKLLSIEKKLSNDALELKIISTWKSRRDFLSYVTDPFIFEFISKSNEHDINNDIISKVFIERENNE